MPTLLTTPRRVEPTDGESLEHGPTDLLARIQALHPQCFGWALSCCDNSRDDAEDVLQDVYLGAVQNGLKFNGESSLKTWLFGVIRQKAYSRRRRERIREMLGLQNIARIAPKAAPEADARAIVSDQREKLRRVLGGLPERQREIVMLVFYHDLTIEQSAEAMGVSVGSARTHYDRAKKKLAVLMNGKRP